MSQRLIAACLAVPLVLALLVYAGTQRLYYATYMPGGTLDVLGTDSNDAEVVQVDGHRVYRDDGQLRMTTVSVTPAQPKGDRGIPLLTLLGVWLDGDDAVYPYDYVHTEDETAKSNEQEGLEQMATSQDDAVAVALTELGIDVPEVIRVAQLLPDMPAQGTLRPGDTLVSVGGTEVTSPQQLVDLITKAGPGETLRIGIQRGEKKKMVSITPVQGDDGRTLIGIVPGVDYEFPFEVKINIDPNIGGPSAGLIFSLAVYDTLTPGSLTGGHEIAGTGEIAPNGAVGPIGGIQQKIAGARDDGAELFLVPAANCDEALQADNGDMRLVRATTMHQARLALEEFVADPDADLPSCEDAA